MGQISDIQFLQLSGDDLIINDYNIVTVTKMNNVVEVQYLERVNKVAPITKIDDDTYIVNVGKNRGEIREFTHIANRSDLYSSLKKTFKKLRYLINNNFFGGKNELFVTLTYAENMQDTKRLYFDFKNFIKRLKYAYKNDLRSDFDYLCIVEPQGRGAWHCHVLFRFNSVTDIFIENKRLAGLWQQGFVNIHRLNDCDNIGAYLTAYLCDIDIDAALRDDKLKNMLLNGGLGYGIKETEVEGKQKKFIKGGRLALYPPKMNLYRKSKGIVMPDRIDMVYEDCKKNVVGFAQPHYTSGIEMFNSDDEHFNKLIYQQYNLNRH